MFPLWDNWQSHWGPSNFVVAILWVALVMIASCPDDDCKLPLQWLQVALTMIVSYPYDDCKLPLQEWSQVSHKIASLLNTRVSKLRLPHYFLRLLHMEVSPYWSSKTCIVYTMQNTSINKKYLGEWINACHWTNRGIQIGIWCSVFQKNTNLNYWWCQSQCLCGWFWHPSWSFTDR